MKKAWSKLKKERIDYEMDTTPNQLLKLWWACKNPSCSAKSRIAQFTNLATLNCTIWDRFPEPSSANLAWSTNWRDRSSELAAFVLDLMRNKYKNQSQIWGDDSSLLPCTSEILKRMKTRRSPMPKRPLECNGCLKRSKKEWRRLHCDQVARRRKVSTFSKSSWMDRRILPIPGPPHDDRHLLQRTMAPEAPVRKDHRAGMQWWWSPSWTDASAKRFLSNTQTLTSLRKEQGRQNSFIAKNERVRQRPFDEALRADLEWQSQHWKTYWSPTSSSSSSQQWWQHEHQHTQWREHQDTQWRDHTWLKEWWLHTLLRDGEWRQNTSSHA